MAHPGESRLSKHIRGTALLALVLVAPFHPLGAQAAPQNVAADVQFMQGMIEHHAQALVMVALIPSRTHRDDMRQVGRRIEISQRDEIGMMQRWLAAHGEAVPTLDSNKVAHMPGMDMPGMDMPGMALMPGMLTQEQLDQLAHATGPEFDRLFLQGMIGHHKGALTMVAQLFATPGGGQASDIFRFASDVDTDQRAEIDRMQAMLDRSAAPVRSP
jgi:uncharacterized protein (DUF305 family)